MSPANSAAAPTTPAPPTSTSTFSSPPPIDINARGAVVATKPKTIPFLLKGILSADSAKNTCEFTGKVKMENEPER